MMSQGCQIGEGESLLFILNLNGETPALWTSKERPKKGGHAMTLVG